LTEIIFALEARVRLDGYFYQLDLITPGISPRSANPRKHSRHTPNFRRNARGRPHSLQRLCLRLLNFGFRASLTLFAVVAINPLYDSY
jgi:argonaute-like protein implicated in RNA metabolism and viral defense